MDSGGNRSCPAPGTPSDAGDREREDSKIDTAAPNPDAFLTPELMRLLDTARQVIDQHVNDHGNCADCGLSWPCQRAQLAEFSLGALLTSDRAALGPDRPPLSPARCECRPCPPAPEEPLLAARAVRGPPRR